MWLHYVYKHYKLTNNEVFYVGKGASQTKTKISYDRANEKCRGAFWKNLVKKYGCRVEIVASCITDKEAQRLEIELITEIGRKDLGTGPLINRTKGGDGGGGRVLTKEQTEARRQKMIQQHINDPDLKRRAAAGRTKQRGIATSIQKGDKLPDWWKQKIAVTKIGTLNPQFGKPTKISKKAKNLKTGIIYDSIAQAAKAEGIEDVFFLYSCLSGNRKNVLPHIVLV